MDKALPFLEKVGEIWQKFLLTIHTQGDKLSNYLGAARRAAQPRPRVW